jgi:hypothetical protein
MKTRQLLCFFVEKRQTQDEEERGEADEGPWKRMWGRAFCGEAENKDDDVCEQVSACCG